MNIDPHVAELGTRLAEIGISNSAGAISTKIQAVKTKRDDKATIQELEEIVSGLIDDRNELIRIAKEYKQELVAQQISEKDIEYITTRFIPVLKDLMKQFPSNGNNVDATVIEKNIDALTPLLSVEMLTILQLVGFNFKKAIGEPLTLLLEKAITSKVPIDPQSNLEYSKLTTILGTEVLKVAQNKDASDRLEQLRAKGIL